MRYPILVLLLVISQTSFPNDGYRLWLQYRPLPRTDYLQYHEKINHICIQETSPVFKVITEELKQAYRGLLNETIIFSDSPKNSQVIIGTIANKTIASFLPDSILKKVDNEGFIIKPVNVNNKNILIIASGSEAGALYGTYYFIRQIQTGNPFKKSYTIENPSFQTRILNHWDNLDGTVERGYAGRSIWWNTNLPIEEHEKRITDYARACASVGINATVLNNVNANPTVLNRDYLEKSARVASILRPYHIKVFLSIHFSSPAQSGGLNTSDPLDAEVIHWWTNKVKEIYSLIPDFGGFLVKANSEGLPGPQDFGRTHADGANMLANALKPYGGIVMWRAFVYKSDGSDRAKQAFEEFKPLDGKFSDNVIVQVKNGPIDFQPREPFSPLFGKMPRTNLMAELQITQEYLGFSDHLVFLGTLYKEFLDADTYVKGRGATLAKTTNGSISHQNLTAIAGVANIGLDTNWCGHHFAQANWYVFGRLAWNHQLTAKQVAEEWLCQTFSYDESFVGPISLLMMQSREAVVNYMTPLGLHHLMGWNHHYGPEPWCEVPGARPDWLPKYYHQADSMGIGFNRSSSGSNAVSQYEEPLRSMFNDPALCPDEYLLWFHHLPWDYTLKNGNDLWTELCIKYSLGVTQVYRFQQLWDEQKGKIDEERFLNIRNKLAIQANEAMWWRDACLLYFQTFSKREIPLNLPRPVHHLERLMKQKFDLNSHN